MSRKSAHQRAERLEDTYVETWKNQTWLWSMIASSRIAKWRNNFCEKHRISAGITISRLILSWGRLEIGSCERVVVDLVVFTEEIEFASDVSEVTLPYPFSFIQFKTDLIQDRPSILIAKVTFSKLDLVSYPFHVSIT